MRGVDLMSSLFSADMDQLRDEFLISENGVDSNQFVLLLLRHCPELRMPATNESASLGATLRGNTSFDLTHRSDASATMSPRTAMAREPTDMDMLEALDDERRDAVQQLFHSIDCDGDGAVTWEEVYNFAISTTMQRLEARPAERIRPYAIAGNYPRDDNVYAMRYLPGLDVLCVSSRHKPLQILDPYDFRPVLTARMPALSPDATVASIVHVPKPDVIVAFTSDCQLHSWAVIDKRLQPLPSIRTEDVLTQLTVPSTQPTTLFASTSAGSIRVYEVSRHFEPRMKHDIPVHPATLESDGSHTTYGRLETNDNIISCFTFITPGESRIVSAAFDRRLCITDLHAVDAATELEGAVGSNPLARLGRRQEQAGNLPPGVSELGVGASVVTHLAYSEKFQLLLAAGVDSSITAWVPHSSKSPKTTFDDPHLPHRRRLAGLVCVPNTPQVISIDAGGMVKVWDIRTFGCTQTIRLNNPGGNPGAADDEASDAMHAGSATMSATAQGESMGAKSRRRVCDAAFVGTMQQIVVADTDGFTTLEYDPGANPTLADEQVVLALLCNPFADTFVTMTASAIGVWDADEGTLRSYHRIAIGQDDLSACCFDDRCRRIIVGTSSGLVRTLAYHGLSEVRRQQVHTREVTGVYYAATTRCIITSSLDGTVGVWAEKDPGSPVSKLRPGLGPLTSLFCEPRLAVLIVGSETGKLELMDLTHPRVIIGDHTGPGAVRCVTPLGRLPMFAVGFATGAVDIISCRPALEAEVMHRIDLSDRHLLSPASPNVRQQANASFTSGEFEGTRSSTTGTAAPASTSLAPVVDNKSFGSRSVVSGLALPPTQSQQQQQRARSTSDTIGGGCDQVPGSTSASSDSPDGHLGGARGDSLTATSMRFDEVSHTLWIGDSAGYLSAWDLCPLLQVTGVTAASYPGTPMFALHAPSPPVRLVPRLAIRAHRDEVSAITILGEHGCVGTCGDDRRVHMWSFGGHPMGELSFGRVSSEPSLMDQGSRIFKPTGGGSPGNGDAAGAVGHRRFTARRAPKEEPQIAEFMVYRVHRPPEPEDGPCTHELTASEAAGLTQTPALELTQVSSRGAASRPLLTPSANGPRSDQQLESGNSVAVTPTTGDKLPGSTGVPELTAGDGEDIDTMYAARRSLSEPNGTPRAPVQGFKAMSSQSVRFAGDKLRSIVGPSTLASRGAASSASQSSVGGADFRGRDQVPRGWKLAGCKAAEALPEDESKATSVHLSTLLGTGARAAIEHRAKTEQDAPNSSSSDDITAGAAGSPHRVASGSSLDDDAAEVINGMLVKRRKSDRKVAPLPSLASNAASRPGTADVETISNSPREVIRQRNAAVAAQAKSPRLPKKLIHEPVSALLLSLADADGASFAGIPSPTRSHGRLEHQPSAVGAGPDCVAAAPSSAAMAWERPTPAGSSAKPPRPPGSGAPRSVAPVVSPATPGDGRPGSQGSAAAPQPPIPQAMPSLPPSRGTLSSANGGRPPPRGSSASTLIRASAFSVAHVGEPTLDVLTIEALQQSPIPSPSKPPKSSTPRIGRRPPTGEPTPASPVAQLTTPRGMMSRPGTSDLEAHNPRRGVATGHVRLGIDRSLKPVIKPDRRALRAEAFEKELHKVRLQARRANPETSVVPRPPPIDSGSPRRRAVGGGGGSPMH